MARNETVVLVVDRQWVWWGGEGTEGIGGEDGGEDIEGGVGEGGL